MYLLLYVLIRKQIRRTEILRVYIKIKKKKNDENNNFKNDKLYYSGRKSSASTATGLFKRHIIEQEELINSLFRDFKNE